MFMEYLIFIILGFLASLIDGCIGMAYGVFLTSSLTFLGYPLLISSSSVHFSEIFTTLFSGLSHFRAGNMDMRVVKKILLPGIIGGIIGALFLSKINNDFIKPIVMVYLLLIGVYILIKFFVKNNKINIRNLPLIGGIGGFVDAVGGGGWGPIVSGSLIAKGVNPRKTIGSVNIVEFFVTFSQSLVFFYFVKFEAIKMIICLIIGGALASPISAYVVKKTRTDILMLWIAFVIICINCWALFSFYM